MTTVSQQRPEVTGVQITGTRPCVYDSILTEEALLFVGNLAQKFEPRRQQLLQDRIARQEELDRGRPLDFLRETHAIRNSEWVVNAAPKDLTDRRVEITGPAGDRKMVINALNSGARVFMADFEDANSPTWVNAVGGQVNLRDAVRRTIEYRSPEGKDYKLQNEVATLMVRPRGWHLNERHMLVDNREVSGSLFDFGLYLYHNAAELVARGSGPYFYLPKLENYLEARLWSDVFCYAEDTLKLPRGTIRATVLIETITAAFEMDEILYELRYHITGLNCGRWDYIFSYIKKQRTRPEALLPDRSLVTMTTDMMHNYSLLAIQTCHRRNAHAIGGMAAQIPIKNDPERNQDALEKVRLDKEREARDGHDGTWVAHPGLVPVAMEVFDRLMPQPNQLDRKLKDFIVTSSDLLMAPPGEVTEEGVRVNVRVGLEYTEAWLRGSGAVPIRNLMEDAATAEISRAQLWQWTHFPNVKLADGRTVNLPLVRSIMDEELADLKNLLGSSYAASQFDNAAELLWRLTESDTLEDFLTIPGYALLGD